ncbi:MAG: hypothetical protein C4B57_03705 [Deltaproteobacteria bacterium]|nr:MAG: hypothetical protein C4B57_03705 [Deltaproteobacteria bacterium]
MITFSYFINIKSCKKKIYCFCKYSVNPLYPALKRLPFSGFQSSLIADRRGSAIRPAIETLQKVNRSCGRARMATVHRKGIFL